MDESPLQSLKFIIAIKSVRKHSDLFKIVSSMGNIFFLSLEVLVLEMTSHFSGKMIRLLHFFCIFSLICFIWTYGNIFQAFAGATEHPSHPPERQIFFLLLSFFIFFGCGWHVFFHEHSEYVAASQRASILWLCPRSQTFLG